MVIVGIVRETWCCIVGGKDGDTRRDEMKPSPRLQVVTSTFGARVSGM